VWQDLGDVWIRGDFSSGLASFFSTPIERLILRWVTFLLLAVALGYVLGYRKGVIDGHSTQRSGGAEVFSLENHDTTLGRETSSRLISQTETVRPKEMTVSESDRLISEQMVLAPKGQSPIEKIAELVNAKLFAEAMELILDADFGDHEEEGLELRALVAAHLAKEWMDIGRRGEAKDLITRERNLQPTHLKLLGAEVEWYRQLGRRPEAIRVLNHILRSGLSEEEREVVLGWRHELMRDHLKVLEESGQWKELADFLKGDPAPGDERYYRYQLWAARAYTEIFEFSKARSALEMASFDHELLEKVAVAESRIERLQAIRHERVSLEKGKVTGATPVQEDVVDDGGWIVLQAVWIQGSVVVMLEVGDRQLPMLLDTGASITSIDLSLRGMLKDNVIKELGARNFYTANGTTQGDVSQLDKVQLGTFVVSSVDVAFMRRLAVGSRYVGLLGMNVLRYFDFQLDETAGVVRLREKL
jgi:clan AA aspartic protease (TIGR02281 family)